MSICEALDRVKFSDALCHKILSQMLDCLDCLTYEMIIVKVLYQHWAAMPNDDEYHKLILVYLDWSHFVLQCLTPLNYESPSLKSSHQSLWLERLCTDLYVMAAAQIGTLKGWWLRKDYWKNAVPIVKDAYWRWYKAGCTIGHPFPKKYHPNWCLKNWYLVTFERWNEELLPEIMLQNFNE